MKKAKANNITLIVDNKEFELEHKIKYVRIIGNLAIVIYDFDENAPRHRQFQNCKAFNENGKLIWTAEHPTSMTADFYMEFIEGRGNKLWNFCGLICELNFKNGKLINKIFSK